MHIDFDCLWLIKNSVVLS